MRHREEDTTEDPTINTSIPCVHELSEQEIFPCLFWVNTRGKRNSPAHGREHSKFASFVKHTKKNPEKKVKDCRTLERPKNVSSSCASDVNNRTAQPNATARMPHEKSTKKMPTRGLMRNVPASCAARFPGGIERCRSVDDAVPGQGDGEKTMAKDEILPPMSTEECNHIAFLYPRRARKAWRQ